MTDPNNWTISAGITQVDSAAVAEADLTVRGVTSWMLVAVTGGASEDRTVSLDIYVRHDGPPEEAIEYARHSSALLGHLSTTHPVLDPDATPPGT